ncbi:MAG: DNA polymerase IV [Oscillospiraceae bacterium]
MERTILHCDLNNFFASVEIHDNPSLADYPVAVCGSTELRSGIVLAKNMKAKEMGVVTAEAIWQAKQKCPDLVTVPPRFDRYTEFSRAARKIYDRYSYAVEPFGIDEAWLDMSGCERLFGSPEEIALKLKEDIKSELGITASVGASFNKVFAKLGSDLKKPDAVTVISKENFKEKIYDLPASDMLGIGKATANKLSRFYINTIGDVANANPEFLKKLLGINGEMIWKSANGLDSSPVMQSDFAPPVKSVGNSSTAIHDLNSAEEINRLFLSLAISVSQRLRKLELEAMSIQIFVKTSDFVSRDFQKPLPFPTRSSRILQSEASKLFFENFRSDFSVRAIGIRAIKLVPFGQGQLSLFEDEKRLEKLEALESCTDKIRERCGKFSVRPASLLKCDFNKEDFCSLPQAAH